MAPGLVMSDTAVGGWGVGGGWEVRNVFCVRWFPLNKPWRWINEHMQFMLWVKLSDLYINKGECYLR